MTNKSPSMQKIYKAAAILMASSFTFTACDLPRQPTDPNVTHHVEKPNMPKGSDVVNSLEKEPVVSVPIDATVLVPISLEKSEPLPDIQIKNFNSVSATVFQTFKLLLENTGISVSADPEISKIQLSAINLSGSLKDVLDNLSETAGIFYTYKRNNLKISTERNFVVSLPPMGEGFDKAAEMIKNMGATNVAVDSTTRNITFRASRTIYENVRNYLENVKKSKSMIVFETYFFEVSLSDEKSVGIDWEDFTGTIGNTSFSIDGGTSVTNGLSFGTVFSSDDFSIDQAISFLRTQGDVQIISKPVLTMVSGTNATFSVGGKIRFVSEVGTTTTDGTSTTTVSTEDLSTGLALTIAGDYLDDTVFADLKLDITSFLDFDTFTATDTELSLPRTTNRNLTTSVRARPGDTILIAGINETRDNLNKSGIPGTGQTLTVPTNVDNSATRSELVIVLQPRVLKFVEKPAPIDLEPAIQKPMPAPAVVSPLKEEPPVLPEKKQDDQPVTPPVEQKPEKHNKDK